MIPMTRNAGLIAVAFGLVLSACTREEKAVIIESPDQGVTTGTAGVAGTQEREVSSEEIVDNPAQYLGSVIEMRGLIDEVISERMFRLDVDGAFGGDDILVVLENEAPMGLDENERVLAEGRVMM